MIYPVIILLVAICTIITLFLIKESFKSERKKRLIYVATIMATCITIVSSISTVLYSFKESEYSLENNIYSLQKEIEYLNAQLNEAQSEILQHKSNNIIIDNSSNETIQQISNQPIIFDNVPCIVFSKNYDETKLNNNGTEFTFYNHPEETSTNNTVTFSFNLEKYNFFSSKININDNINNEENFQTTVGFYNETGEQLHIEKFDCNNLSAHIYIDVSNLTTLTIIIKTNMVSEKEELFRTVSFSDIVIE